MTDDRTVRGGNELTYHGVRSDLSSYAQPVLRTNPRRSSELFSIWPCLFDDGRAMLKEAAGGPRSGEARIRLRREQAIMLRLATARKGGRRLVPFLGYGDEVSDTPEAPRVSGHEHHFTHRLVTLRDHLGTTLSVGDRGDLVVAVFDALAELHDEQVVHRDVKLGNLVRDPVTGLIEFIDFGHAFDETASPSDDDPATGESGFVGTDGWMCPHCYLRRTTDRLCDVFAMALVGTVILTGEIQHPPLPVVGSSDSSRNSVSPGALLPAHRDIALQQLERYRGSLVAQDLGAATLTRLLDPLLLALTPEPREADGTTAARLTAREMHEALVEARRRPTSQSDAIALPSTASAASLSAPPSDELDTVPAAGPPPPPSPPADDPSSASWRPEELELGDEPDSAASTETAGDDPSEDDTSDDPPRSSAGGGRAGPTMAADDDPTGGATADEARGRRSDVHMGFGALPTVKKVEQQTKLFARRARVIDSEYRVIDLLGGTTVGEPDWRDALEDEEEEPEPTPPAVAEEPPHPAKVFVIAAVVVLVIILIAVLSVNGA